MPAPKEIHALVERFEQSREAYTSGDYNETQLRREFLDPFFTALGWDVENKQGYAEAYKDVVHEDSIKIGTATKAPDYSFRIGGIRKFFVEAKKPSTDVKEDIGPAYQLRRYAWSANLPLSILTDFEELAVYDCRIKPRPSDKSSVGRILYFTYADYIEKWDDFAGIFSREAVLKGSFDKYVESTKGKKGTAKVDDAFLKEIEVWRDLLAKNIAAENTKLSVRDLNFAVQRTIDRIIFLRICEDRGIETYGMLLALTNGGRIYNRLCEIFYRGDEKYNSGLFHFQKEKERDEPPDEFTPNLRIDDEPLKKIIKGLYYPESSYEFSVLPADILGQVYEQFLGKVIRLTAGHQAKVEDKPEVKKAGGVYYTPTYIVDYIVKNTVGKILEELEAKNKSTEKLVRDVSKIRILDPACGSGSFLIGAYQYLLDWHRDRYVKDGPQQWASGKNPTLYQAQGGEWRLTAAERKRILINNIHGVDIDPQAVEVTKLSLLLKVLEGENEQTISRQLKMFHQRALPDLGKNIKCGNSLIGPDFYEGQQLSLMDDKERIKINAFDWTSEFKEIMEAGGFDAVIGNPPYIPIESMGELEKRYYQAFHPELDRKYDSSVVFILSMKAKLNRKGLLGFISSLTWQTGENYGKLRRALFTQKAVDRLVNLPFNVFRNAYVDTGIYILSAEPRQTYKIFRFPKKAQVTNLNELEYTGIRCDFVIPPDFKIILNPAAQRILSRTSDNSMFTDLGSISISTQGLAGNMFIRTSKRKNDNWLPFLERGQVYRYHFEKDNITYTNMSQKMSLIQFYTIGPKIVIRRVINRQDRLMATIDTEELVYKKDINPFRITDTKINPIYVLGIVNSKLVSYLYVNSSSIATKDDFRQTTLTELRRIPIRNINFSDPADKSRHDRMVSLVETMLDLHKKLAAAKTEQDQTPIKRQIEATDKQIDELVYELYGLTEEERKIVEGS